MTELKLISISNRRQTYLLVILIKVLNGNLLLKKLKQLKIKNYLCFISKTRK